MKSRIYLIAAGLLVVALVSGCAGTKGALQNSILSQVMGNPDLTTFSSLLQQAGLEKMLKGSDPITLLAPSNDAFKALPEATLNGLFDSQNKDQVINMVKGHILTGNMNTSDLASAGGGVKNLLGQSMNFNMGDNGLLSTGGAQLVQSNIKSDNGVIHVIDNVLMP